MRCWWLLCFVLAALSGACSSSGGTADEDAAPAPSDAGPPEDAGKQSPVAYFDLDIPVRDGRTLKGDVYLPDATGSFPTIYIHTPYDKTNCGGPLPEQQTEECLRFAPEHFAYVVVDWRGRAASKDAEVIPDEDCKLRLPHEQLRGWNEGDCPTEGTDGVDVVKWIRTQDWSDGKVGMWGISAVGSVQFKIITQAEIDGVPNIDCAVPSSGTPETHYGQVFEGGVLDAHHASTLVAAGFDVLKFFLDHPTHDEVWEYADAIYAARAAAVDVPLLLITGWYDTNPRKKAALLDVIRAGKEHAQDMRLVIGPWHHTDLGGLNQGDLSFPAAEDFADKQTERFFESCLRGQDNGWDDEPAVRYFQMGDDQWHSSGQWPLSASESQVYYLHSDGGLNEVAPSDEVSTAFDHDPEDLDKLDEATWTSWGGSTIVFQEGCNEGTPAELRWYACLFPGPRDISHIEEMDNVLTYGTEPLAEDLATAGEIELELYLSSSATITDVAVRVADVHPDGRSILVGDVILNTAFRESSNGDAPAMEPGTVYPLTLKTTPVAHTWKAGHRLRISINGSLFPRFRFSPYPVPATNSVHHEAAHPSRIVLRRP